MAMFAEDSGFGDPEARQNAELRIYLFLSQQQSKNSSQLNLLMLLLVVVGLLNAVVLASQVWGN
ncbi:MAG: hypothetical protein ABIK92_10350 [Pseudomonadota bacterium]